MEWWIQKWYYIQLLTMESPSFGGNGSVGMESQSRIYSGDRVGILWNLSSLTICHSLTRTLTFLILIGYEALSLTVAMVIVSEWQIVSDDKFHEMPPPPVLVVTRASCYSCVFSKTRRQQEFSVISDEKHFKPTLHAKFGDHYTAIRKSYGQKKTDFYLSE